MIVRPPRAAFLVLLGVSLLAAACDSGTTSPTILPGAPFSETDLVIGTGDEAAPGRTATVNYTGWIYDPDKPDKKGTQFQTSVGGTPLTFPVGANRVIPGFDQGVQGMRVGGRRRIVVPPDLAYGSEGSSTSGIPPYATLVFDVDLLSVQ
jgi:FKBP-type peptidyl-prolyl cis-trans isomerase FkpA